MQRLNLAWRKALLTILVILAAALAELAGCAPMPPSPEPSLEDKAALEATAIIQRARATAIVLQAQSTAAALMQSASTIQPTPVSTVPVPTSVIVPRLTPAPAMLALTPVASAMSSTVGMTETGTLGVELLGVGFAADGAYVHVQFKAPPQVARGWKQGNVYVTDEATGIVYKDIPVMPILGPLIGHPQYGGQIGYVMLFNTSSGIKPGSVVTVVLGNYKQEHVIVKGPR